MKIQTKAPQNTAQTAKTNNVVITGLSDQGESTTKERVENLLKELNIEIDNFQAKRIGTERPERERERLSLSAFLRTEDIGVHIVHISRLIITYTLE